jgi:hypothetical protein
MGVDLRLLPQYSQNADFAHDILECDRDYYMFDIISEAEKQNGRQVPRNGINTFTARGKNDEMCYGKTIETPYGGEMNSVQARKLKKVLANYKTNSWRNKAVIAFLNEIPDELEIWLYWH